MIDRAPQHPSLLTDSPAAAHRPRSRRNNIPAAILTGGAAFAGAFGLLLTTAHYAAA